MSVFRTRHAGFPMAINAPQTAQRGLRERAASTGKHLPGPPFPADGSMPPILLVIGKGCGLCFLPARICLSSTKAGQAGADGGT